MNHARLVFVSAVLALAACGPNVSNNDDTPGDDACPECVCQPGIEWCDGNDIRECNDDGTAGDVVSTCPAEMPCHNGYCANACEIAADNRSNIGCEYWGVDLDNEYSEFNDAAAEQYAVVLANTSDFIVNVTVEQNEAAPGAPVQLTTVQTTTINPNSLVQIDLPRREVDGSLNGMDEGPGTMLSSRAYRIRTDRPVVAYQFNPIVQSFSNGASLLIPTSGLDTSYLVLGWPTSNPIAPFPIPGIPDHSYVTIVGVSENPVNVTVRLGGPIVGGGGIPAGAAGDVIEVTLGQFDVLNLESTGIPGDMTSTEVTANGPVAVFSGGERASVPYDVRPPPPAGWKEGDTCCTEHFEQQLFPLSSLGRAFVTTRSPVRSGNPNNPEGDVWRVMATEAGTTVTTSLGGEFGTFNLGKGEFAEFWSIRDFVLTADKPVMVGQFLVSQQYVESPDVGGDPEFILYPPAEQFREEYIFLAPPTFEKDWCVIAAPASAQVSLDGEVLGELSTRCQQYPAGTLDGVEYIALRCELTDGVHYVTASEPVGVNVYGYYNVGSYGYAAGSELERINID